MNKPPLNWRRLRVALALLLIFSLAQYVSTGSLSWPKTVFHSVTSTLGEYATRPEAGWRQAAKALEGPEPELKDRPDAVELERIRGEIDFENVTFAYGDTAPALSDVDLHVVDPRGEEVFYGHPNSASGGRLDLDSNAACDLDHKRNENITWPVGRAPRGRSRCRRFDRCAGRSARGRGARRR